MKVKLRLKIRHEAYGAPTTVLVRTIEMPYVPESDSAISIDDEIFRVSAVCWSHDQQLTVANLWQIDLASQGDVDSAIIGLELDGWERE